MKLMSYYDMYDQTDMNFVPNLIQIGVDNTSLSHQGKQFFPNSQSLQGFGIKFFSFLDKFEHNI